jgi:hypothetical protein
VPASKKLIGLDKRFADCEFLVEATPCEQHSLWREFHVALSSWEEDSMAFASTICVLDNRPVNICFTFCKIDGHRTCFYYGSSQVVDHKAIEDFLLENFEVKYDEGARWAHCDAMNFHLCLSCVLSKKAYDSVQKVLNLGYDFERLFESAVDCRRGRG